MPLGEYVPGEWRWPGLHDWFQLNEFMLPGTESSSRHAGRRENRSVDLL